jgi:hypothetical protein
MYANQRDIAVGRAELEVRMKQHEDRPDDAERHVDFEPCGDRAQPGEPGGALARRIDQ